MLKLIILQPHAVSAADAEGKREKDETAYQLAYVLNTMSGLQDLTLTPAPTDPIFWSTDSLRLQGLTALEVAFYGPHADRQRPTDSMDSDIHAESALQFIGQLPLLRKLTISARSFAGRPHWDDPNQLPSGAEVVRIAFDVSVHTSSTYIRKR